jgi:hypothetical protein
MENDRVDTELELHAERITISDQRYLIYYTFSEGSDVVAPEAQVDSEEAAE